LGDSIQDVFLDAILFDQVPSNLAQVQSVATGNLFIKSYEVSVNG